MFYEELAYEILNNVQMTLKVHINDDFIPIRYFPILLLPVGGAMISTSLFYKDAVLYNHLVLQVELRSSNDL